MVDFKATTQGGKGTLAIVYSNGDSKTLQSTHPAYAEVLTYFATHPDASTHDEEHIREISNPAVRIGKMLKAVDDRYDFDMFTLSFEGLPLAGALADLIKDRLANGKADWERFAKFLARLESNPSYGAKQALYTFVQGNGLTILSDGRFVGHKAVARDGLSKHSGPNNYIDGVLYGKPGKHVRVPHAVGTVVSKRRGDVDDSGMACSTGLHVGSLSYASGFADVLVTVAVAPEDVVGGEYASKFRTERYEILGLNEGKADFVGPDYEIVDRSDVLSEAEKEFALGADRLSRRHEFTEEEAREYNSLPSVGRTEYDKIRTVLNKSHRLAFETALADHGTYEEFLARRDAERAEQARLDAAAAWDAERAKDDAAVAAAAERAVDEEAVTLSGLANLSTMEEKADASPALKGDLLTKTIGHKPLARKWAGAGVTESSVRRWRRANSVEVTSWTKVKDALS